MKMERRTHEASVECRDDGGSPKIVGTASVFYDGTERTEFVLWDDRGKYEGGVKMVERIMPKAFNGVMKDDVRALFNHDPNLVLGRSNGSTKTLRMSKDESGLHYSITPGDTTTARDTIEHIQRGDVSGSSFAFTIAPKGQKFSEDGDVAVREITKVEQLYDVGPVVYPAYESTDAGVRSSGDLGEARDAWQGHQDAEQARIAAKHADYKAITDALQSGLDTSHTDT